MKTVFWRHPERFLFRAKLSGRALPHSGRPSWVWNALEKYNGGETTQQDTCQVYHDELSVYEMKELAIN